MLVNPITIRNLGPDDSHVLDRVRAGTFDNPIDPARAWAFLATRVNELVVALDRGEVIGFASGTVLMHPDKPTAFFIQEVGVHDEYTQNGIGARLVERISELAADRGCEVVWVATEGDNLAARKLYAKLGGRETKDIAMYEWGDA